MAPRKIPMFAISIGLYLIVIVGLVILVLYVRKKFKKLGVSDLGKWTVTGSGGRPDTSGPLEAEILRGTSG